MKKSIPIGKSDFKRVISENYYYVDKTALIEEILRKKPEVLLLTRPRRFGKTLNMSTLKYFFDIKDGIKNRELFKGLKIEKTEYMSEQGKYPVVFMSMKELSGETYEEFFKEFQIVLKDVYSEHSYLRDTLKEWERIEFDKILYKDETAEYTVALKNLSRYLFEYHGVKPVLLIDEYDAPMINADEKGYYEKAKNLISKFYGSALKDGICAFAVVTGILKEIFQSQEEKLTL